MSLLRSDFFDRALPWTNLILADKHGGSDLNLNFVNRASTLLVALSLVALVAGLFWRPTLLALPLIAALLLILNAGVYRFFARTRGLIFALRVVPWHWIYYFCGGFAFAIGSTAHLCRGRPSTTSQRLLPEHGQELSG